VSIISLGILSLTKSRSCVTSSSLGDLLVSNLKQVKTYEWNVPMQSVQRWDCSNRNCKDDCLLNHFSSELGMDILLRIWSNIVQFLHFYIGWDSSKILSCPVIDKLCIQTTIVWFCSWITVLSLGSSWMGYSQYFIP